MKLLRRIIPQVICAAMTGVMVHAETVQATLAVVPANASAGEEVELRLTLTVAESWHAYGHTGGPAGQSPLELKTILPSGIEPFGDWVWPKPEIVYEGRAIEIYTGQQTFTRELKITTASNEVTFRVEVSYQACTAEFCGPPETVEATTVLKIEGSDTKADGQVSTVRESPSLASQGSAAASGWLTDFDEAQQLAERTGRKLLLDFTGSDWCAACIKLEHEVFTRPEFRRFASDYILVRLDYPLKSFQPAEEKTRNAALKERYAIKGYPTVILADADGRELKRLVGYDPQTGLKDYLVQLAAPQGQP